MFYSFEIGRYLKNWRMLDWFTIHLEWYVKFRIRLLRRFYERGSSYCLGKPRGLGLNWKWLATCVMQKCNLILRLIFKFHIFDYQNFFSSQFPKHELKFILESKTHPMSFLNPNVVNLIKLLFQFHKLDVSLMIPSAARCECILKTSM